METRRLAYFVEIVDAGSIGRAAAALGLTQPGLSQQLAILEKEVGVRLLNRAHDGVQATAAGQALYVRAQSILRQVSTLRGDLRDAGAEVSGPVALGVTPTQALSVGLVVLERVLRDHRRIGLQIVEEDSAALLAMVQGGLLDMAVVPAGAAPAALAVEPLVEEALYLVQAASAPPPPAGLAALAALPWIATRSPNAIRSRLSALFAPAGLEPNYVAEVNSLPLVLEAVARGHGVTLLPREAVERSRVAALALWPFPHARQGRTLSLVTRRDALKTPGTEVVAGVVRDWAQASESGLRSTNADRKNSAIAPK